MPSLISQRTDSIKSVVPGARISTADRDAPGCRDRCDDHARRTV